MILSLSIKNFRNFPSKEISFSGEKNLIIGDNGRGKSNLLEALCSPVSPLVESHPKYLLERGQDVFFLSYDMEDGKCSFSYDGKTQKRKYIINGKSTTKQKLSEFYPHVVSFHPMMMNLMYLGPSERRNFLDEVLSQSFSEYKKIFLEYKKILLNRNKLLKNISEGRSTPNELDFWDTKFLESAEQVYIYRKKIIDFFHSNIGELKEYFFGKIENIEFQYISKIDVFDIKNTLGEYISNNRQKEILLRKTLRGPHLDDFNILIDENELIHFASRGEVKSIILGLKFLETRFIEIHSPKKDILFVIDDLLSELDEKHRDLLWEHIGERQSFISSIEDFEVSGNKIYLNS